MKSTGSVDVFLLGQYVAPIIVLVGIRRVICVARAVVKVLPNKLVCRVVGVGEAQAPLCDRGDIPVRVIGIAVGTVRAVLISGNKRRLRTVRAGGIRPERGLRCKHSLVLSFPA